MLKFDIGTENEYVPNEKAGEHHVHMKTPGHLKWHGACLCNDHVVAVPNCAATKVSTRNKWQISFNQFFFTAFAFLSVSVEAKSVVNNVVFILRFLSITRKLLNSGKWASTWEQAITSGTIAFWD